MTGRATPTTMARPMTTFTALRVTEAGVVLYDAHRRRLTATDDRYGACFDAWAALATPGIYAICARDGALEIEARPASRLFEGIGVRYVPSPFRTSRGAFAKPPPPSPYAGVRVPDLASLLTDEAGEVLYESCAASIFAWDGATLVAVPEETPRVASVAEACIAAALPHRRAPIPLASSWPLVLTNAAAGVCQPSIPGRGALPEDVRRAMEAALARTVRRAVQVSPAPGRDP